MTDVMRSEAGGRGLRGKVEERLGRGNRSPLGLWFWEIDRVLLLVALLLIGIGLVAVAAASPASAVRYSDTAKSFPPMYYFYRQAIWVFLSIPVMLVVSMMPTLVARRFALTGAGIMLLLLAIVPFVGDEKNGARRWIGLGFTQFQPSEFLKPFFVVAVAWLLSLRARDPDLPLFPITMALTGLIGGLLMLQPDFGQTVVFVTVWVTMLLIAGTNPKVIGGLAGVGVGGIVAAYFLYNTARVRIDAFLFPDPDKAMSDHYQTDMAHAVITGGGFTGTGPGGGMVKFKLPEAHTDYIYSVIGEEFGLIACMIVAVLFLALVVRVFVKLLDEEDAFRLFAASGLAVQFGLQALINMAVNTGIAPSKGMTLPFISYGGSSMIALSIGFGLLLAFTRRNPYLKRSPYSVRLNRP